MGKRLNWVKLAGDPDDTFCRLEHVNQPRKIGIKLHQIMRDHLAKHSPVNPRVSETDVP